jgi:hypothetical protein
MMSWACAKIASGHLQPWISCALGACKTFLLVQAKFRLSCHDVKKNATRRSLDWQYLRLFSLIRRYVQTYVKGLQGGGGYVCIESGSSPPDGQTTSPSKVLTSHDADSGIEIIDDKMFPVLCCTAKYTHTLCHAIACKFRA